MPTYIGREQELDNALATLAGRRRLGKVQDVVGMHGIGKSSYLAELADRARKLPDVVVFEEDMKRPGFGENTPDFGRNASTYVLWGTFSRSCDLMSRFAGRDLAEFDDFRTALRDQRRAAEHIQSMITVQQSRGSSISGASLTAFVNESADGVKQSIRELQSRVDDAFVRAWAKFTAKRRVLITADSFELVGDDEMGGWLIRMAGRLPNTLVVLARVPSDTHVAIDSAQVDRVALSPFTADETATYFDTYIDGVPVDRDLVGIAHDYTDGHPGGVSLIASLIEELGGATLEAASLRRVLARLQARGDERWAELVRLILDAIHDPTLTSAVEAVALTTTFDARLLHELIARDDTTVADGDIVTQLLGLGLLQQLPGASGQRSDRYRLHEFIRLSVASRLRERDPRAWEELHRRVAQHYFRKMKGWDDAPYDAYGAWYRFEDPAWQEYKREWLYHSGMLHARPLTRARFVLVFLEAFWWWGWYIPFPFCRSLLADWAQATTAWANSQRAAAIDVTDLENKERQLDEALGFVLDNYPPTHVKPADAPWDDIRIKLLLVGRLCNHHETRGFRLTAEERDEIKRANALLQLILAHTRRYRDPSDPMAEQYYRDSLTAFDELKDEWNVSWLLYERADLAFERGAPAEALALVVDSANWAKNLLYRNEEWDHELAANLQRTRADVLWQRGDVAAAGTGYGRAVAHAYWFQGDPHPPDEYTQQIYVEMTTRTAERMAELNGDPAARSAFAEAVRRELPECRELFPAGPKTDELRLDDTEFMTTWDVRHEEWINPAGWLQELARGS